MRARAAAAAAALALAGCGGSGGPSALGPAALVDELRDGGEVVYLRHAHTDRSREDQLGAPLEDCARQRNLSELGREQARAIGRAVEALGIPVGRVLSSEYCRTLETARLAFGRAEVVDDLSGITGEESPDRDRRAAALRALLAERPRPGTNTVVSGHIANLEAATGVHVDEGEAAVFAPDGGDFRLLGRIPAEAWPQLADELAR